MKRILFFIFLIAVSVQAQEIPLGTWRTHFSYNDVRYVEQGVNRIYAAASAGLFIYSFEDNSITTVTKLNGLQEEDISSIHFNEQTESLFIGYESGNLDVIRDSEIINIDLITDSQLTGSKAINGFLSDGGSVFLFTDFGLLKMNPQSFAVIETVREIGQGNKSLEIYDGAILGDSLFVATGEGILATNIIDNINLADPTVWKRFGPDENLVNEPFQFVVKKDELLLAGSSGNGIYSFKSSWTSEDILSDQEYLAARSFNDATLVVTNQGLFSIDFQLEVSAIQDELLVKPADALVLDGDIYAGTERDGLVAIGLNGSESILPSGPLVNQAFRLASLANGIHGFAGGYGASVNPLNNPGSFSIFNEGLWTSFENGVELPSFTDVIDGVYQSTQNRTVLALAGQGLLIINDDGTGEIINDTSPGSTLVNTTGDDKGVVITDLHNDAQGLWILNYDSPTPIHLWAENGSWTSFSLGNNQLTEVVGDSRQLYIISSNGLLIFDKSSGASRLLTDAPNNGGLVSDAVSSIALDRDGLLWIGTDQGVSVLTNPLTALEGNVDAIEPIFENRPLLRDEIITAIAVDGGDRKWIGTNSGVWLFDAQADRQLLNFTVSNSPLSSNEILDIAIEPNTGEVFFSTTSGVVSYREGATEAIAIHQDVRIFPNPVTADFTGTVGISGLVQDAQVRITDASGKLIWRTRAAGGTATWQVRDYNGNRASTGVYFVFSSDDEGEETFVGKIAVVN